MTSIQVETKNKADIDKKPRVWFACHPDDFEKHFKTICEDIFRTHDCAVYYTRDMTEMIAEEEQDAVLGRCNLFVIPVTYKLLTTPNRTMDVDFPYAKKEHIPILPIVLEPGLDPIYAREDKFGELQYLNPYSTDRTEISYAEKLKKHLESVLISDALAKRVRAAFDAYIFLSYRKKDRKYANELMTLIHSNPDCRDIAIWFDEFLVPGESFKEGIEKILDDCQLFTLLITPHILEKVINAQGELQDNYVVSTELPLARQKKQEKGIDILGVEMQDTDRQSLSEIEIEDYVSYRDEAFRARLLESITKIASSANNSPEHNFLIGMAYSDGIDVEVDKPRALELITSAAQDGLPEAMQRLREMYTAGIGVAPDYKQAACWAERHYRHMRTHRSNLHPDTLASMYQLALALDKAGEHKKAFRLKRKLYVYQRIMGGSKSNNTLIARSQLASTYSDAGQYKKALRIYKKIYAILCKKHGQEHPKAFNSLNDIALTYHRMGDYEQAVKLQEKASLLAYDTFGEDNPETHTYLENLAIYLSDSGDFEKANAFAQNIYELCTKLFGEKHPQTLCALNTLAATIHDLGDPEKAAELQKQAYADCCSTLGEEHPYTVTLLSNWARYCLDLRRYEDANSKLETVYTLYGKVLGQEHPDTIKALGDLAVTQFYLGHYADSISLGEKAYALCCKICGKDHPRSLDILQNLAAAYFMADDHNTSLQYYQKLLAQSIKVHGKNHQRTRDARKNLADLEAIMHNRSKT